MFRFLNKKEEANFRLWARTNYTPFTEISELWHPVVRDECRLMCEGEQIHFQNANTSLMESIREE